MSQMLVAAMAAALFALWFGGAGWFIWRKTLPSSPEELQAWRILLQAAIHDGGMVLHYQAEVDPTTGRATAVEALPYWQHPQQGLVPSTTFLQIAENADLEIELGEWVLKTATTAHAGSTSETPDDDIELKIKFTPNQLLAPQFLDTVDYALSHSRMNPAKLRIEVALHDSAHSSEQVVKVLASLCDRKVGVAPFA